MQPSPCNVLFQSRFLIKMTGTINFTIQIRTNKINYQSYKKLIRNAFNVRIMLIGN